ncbi:MAG: hypothetical protein EOO01_19885 [Chitinophagaceae bacterium]|nr:MAG: hypothetical protein EOO01_19885 [Chitinophagaceae bacterium]
MKSVFAALLVITVFVGYSKKTGDLPRSFRMEGLWEGRISTAPNSPGRLYQLRLSPDGTLERINTGGTPTASGNWELSGRRFTATYNYSNGTIVILNGIVDKEEGTITAVWENNGNDNGHIAINKK